MVPKQRQDVYLVESGQYQCNVNAINHPMLLVCVKRCRNAARSLTSTSIGLGRIRAIYFPEAPVSVPDIDHDDNTWKKGKKKDEGGFLAIQQPEEYTTAMKEGDGDRRPTTNTLTSVKRWLQYISTPSVWLCQAMTLLTYL